VKNTGEIDTEKDLAAQLAAWDGRISEVAALKNDQKEPEPLNLICSFEPEPSCDTIGYFWIANLLVRMEFENFDPQQPFDLGFKIGKQIFLPDGRSVRKIHKETVLWPEPDE